MHTRFLKLSLVGLFGALLLSGCRPAFPTGKFARSQAAVNHYLIFYPDGRWEGFQDGNLLTFGAYTTKGEQVQFESDFLCQEAGFPQAAAYAWAFEDERLNFQLMGEDTCAARVALLSGEFQRSE